MSAAWLIRGDDIINMKPWALFYDFALLSIVIARGGCRKNDLGDRATILYKTVNFMAQRPEQMNIDAVYGLTLTEANLKSVLRHENIKNFDAPINEFLRKILRLTRKARKRAIAVINSNSSAINRIINHPRIWMRPIQWTYHGFSRPLPNPNITEESVTDTLYQGTPKEDESDTCITELAIDTEKKHCQVSDHCASVLLRNDNPRGYPLTHRLLYIQIAIAVGCTEHVSTPFQRLIYKYCSDILQDAVDMEAAGFPSISRDMISEQVILCGREGFLQFANDHYANLIVSWANPKGCYSGFGTQNNRGELTRMKRETEFMDFGCDNHATALAAASLSLLIRQYIETFPSLQDQ